MKQFDGTPITHDPMHEADPMSLPDGVRRSFRDLPRCTAKWIL